MYNTHQQLCDEWKQEEKSDTIYNKSLCIWFFLFFIYLTNQAAETEPTSMKSSSF